MGRWFRSQICSSAKALRALLLISHCGAGILETQRCGTELLTCDDTTWLHCRNPLKRNLLIPLPSSLSTAPTLSIVSGKPCQCSVTQGCEVCLHSASASPEQAASQPQSHAWNLLWKFISSHHCCHSLWMYPSLLITSYADNVIFIGPLSVVHATKDRYSTKMQVIGLLVYSSESAIFVPNDRQNLMIKY